MLREINERESRLGGHRVPLFRIDRVPMASPNCFPISKALSNSRTYMKNRTWDIHYVQRRQRQTIRSLINCKHCKQTGSPDSGPSISDLLNSVTFPLPVAQDKMVGMCCRPTWIYVFKPKAVHIQIVIAQSTKVTVPSFHVHQVDSYLFTHFALITLSAQDVSDKGKECTHKRWQFQSN